MANIILNATNTYTAADLAELRQNGAEPLEIMVSTEKGNAMFLVWRSSWKWQPSATLMPQHRRDIDGYGVGEENSIWAEYARKMLVCVK